MPTSDSMTITIQVDLLNLYNHYMSNFRLGDFTAKHSNDPQVRALKRLQASQTDSSKKLEIQVLIEKRIEELEKLTNS